MAMVNHLRMALRKGKWLMQQGSRGAGGKDEEDKAMECRGDRRNELLFSRTAKLTGEVRLKA